MNEVVRETVDIRIDHQRINKAQDDHDPQRCVREEEEKCDEKCEMKKTTQRRQKVPARVSEQLGGGLWSFYDDWIGIHLENTKSYDCHDRGY